MAWLFHPHMKTSIPTLKPTSRGFTLLELLVVIGLIGLMTFIAIPAFKGFGQANKLAAAQRQITDDLGSARQYAIKYRTPVFMVFFAPPLDSSENLQPFPQSVSANYQQWLDIQRNGSTKDIGDLGLRTFTNVYAAMNACYAFYTEQKLGDQPGVQNPRYLSFSGNIWRSLPEGIIFAPNMAPLKSTQGTATTNLALKTVPFPVADQLGGQVPRNSLQRLAWPTLRLPVLAFDSQGRLIEIDKTSDALLPNKARSDRYVAIGLGTAILTRKPPLPDVPGSGVRHQASDFDFSGPIDILETPRANYTNSFYRVLALTGRARKQPWPLY